MRTFNHKNLFKYGEKPPASKKVRVWLRNVGLNLPVKVISIEINGRSFKSINLTSSDVQLWVLNPDNGMLYITYNGSVNKMKQLCEKESLLYGESFICETADQWLNTLRMAIVSVRKKYLACLTNLKPESLTLECEQEHREIALIEFQRGLQWKESVSLWIDITMIRHQNDTANLLRKLIEFLAYATEAIDSDNDMSFHFVQAIQKIVSDRSFPNYSEFLIQVLEDLRPYMVLNRTQHVLSRKSYPQIVRKALNIIRESYIDPITLHEISKLCFVSSEHLSRIFKRETGYTVTEFINLLRIERAKQLLTTTDEGIMEIAFDSGFNTMEYFHRVFKKYTCLTPAHYRKFHLQR